MTRHRKSVKRDLCVGPEVLVTFSYDLYDGEGEWVEASDPAQPPTFLHGFGQVVPAVERALEGGRVGQLFRIQLSAAEAYGERDEAAIIEVARTELPAEVALGAEFEAENEDGRGVWLKVLELDDERAVLDANHPLAGQKVELDVTIEALQTASSEQISEALARLEQSAGRGVQTLLPAERLLKRGVAPEKDGLEPVAPPEALKSSHQA